MARATSTWIAASSFTPSSRGQSRRPWEVPPPSKRRRTYACAGHSRSSAISSSRLLMSDSIESWLVSAGRDRRPGSPLNVPPIPASNFVLGEHRAYSRDDGTPGWEALEEILGGLEAGSSVAFGSGMAGIAAIFDQLLWRAP